MGPQDDPTRILLIEDSDPDADLVHEFLKRERPGRFKITRAQRLLDAVELLKVDTFDIILLDLSLPDVCGLEAYTALQGLTLDIPLVVLTGLEDDCVAMEAVQMGAQDFLTKSSISSQSLVRCLDYALARKKADLRARQAEDRLRFALKASRTGIWERDLRSGKITWDDNMAAIFGITPGTTPQTFQDLLAHVHPGDRERVANTVAAAQRAAGEFEMEYRVVWADESVHHIVARGICLCDKAGKPVRNTGVCFDVSDLHQAEQELGRRLRQQATVARLGQKALCDESLETLFQETALSVSEVLEIPTCTIVKFSAPEQTYLMSAGTGWAEKLIGHELPGINPRCPIGLTFVENCPTIVEILLNDQRFDAPSFLSDNLVVSTVLIPVKVADGTLAALGVHSLTQRTFLSSDVDFLQSIANILGSAVTRKMAERKERLLSLMEQREDFMATLTHDLKNPLLGANRILDLFVDDKLGELTDEQKQVLLKLRESNHGLLALVQNLIEVYRYEKAAGSLVFQEADVVQIIKYYLDEIAAEARHRQIEIKMHLPRDPVIAWIDTNGIRRVFQNLVDNAIKFTPPEGQISVRISQTENRALLEVVDTGPGIAPEDIPRLFQRFWQSDAGKRYYPGTGLGLYLCRQIVALHHGTISCESTQGVGSKFIVALPLCQASSKVATAATIENLLR